MENPFIYFIHQAEGITQRKSCFAYHVIKMLQLWINYQETSTESGDEDSNSRLMHNDQVSI